METVREVAAETYARLYQPRLKPFNLAKSTAGQYIFGQALNAAGAVKHALRDRLKIDGERPREDLCAKIAEDVWRAL